MAVGEEEEGEEAEADVEFDEGFDVGVGVDEADDHCFPAAGGGHVEDNEDQGLDGQDDQEDGVDELEHCY